MVERTLQSFVSRLTIGLYCSTISQLENRHWYHHITIDLIFFLALLYAPVCVHVHCAMWFCMWLFRPSRCKAIGHHQALRDRPRHRPPISYPWQPKTPTFCSTNLSLQNHHLRETYRVVNYGNDFFFPPLSLRLLFYVSFWKYGRKIKPRGLR